MGFPIARDFQRHARERLIKGFKAGHKNQLVMAPTGSGKTILAMFLISECLEKGKRAVFIADRRTLINQTSEVADSLGLSDHSVMMAGHWRFDPSSRFQIASAQTIARRGWPEADLYVIDECHTQLKAWTENVKHRNAATIGLSATPFSKGLGLLFDNLINAITMKHLTDVGVLVPMRVLTCTEIDMRGAATSGGEWTDQAAEERGTKIIGDAVSDWLEHANGLKTIAFGATIRHCEALCREFNESGIMAALFTSRTTESERKDILEEYRDKNSPLKILVSVEALAKGFDNPFVECVMDLRPLRKSLSTAIQMWGRGLRCSPGKKECLLLDFSGNIVRFARDYEDIFFNGLSHLNKGEKLDAEVREPKEKAEIDPICPDCGFKPFFKACMSCGFERQMKADITKTDGVMKEFFIGGVNAGTRPNIWNSCVNLCKTKGNPVTMESRAKHLYRSITKEEPNGLLKFYEVPAGVIDPLVINKYKSNIIKYTKGRRGDKVRKNSP